MLLKVLTGKLTFNSLKPLDISCCTKREIKAYFENSYDLNDSLFVALKDDSCFYKQPDRLRLPLIFYYGHTACVYVNKLVLSGLLQPSDRVSLEYETLFETGVDEMSWDDTECGRMGEAFAWPNLDPVVEYRRKVRKLILKLIDETPLKLPITMDSPWWALLMGMEHERIHIETSSVLIRQLPVEMVCKPDGWKYAPLSFGSGVQGNPFIQAQATEVTIGKPEDFPSYGWDNEYGKWHCKVPAFEASKYLITNKEFYEFVKVGGYDKKELWTEEGWHWVNYRQAMHPTFWVCSQGCIAGCGGALQSYSHCKPQKYQGVNGYCNGHSNVDGNGHQGSDEGGGHQVAQQADGSQEHQYRYRAMFDVIDMPWDWPVEVNYHEAKAFCTWKGPEYRLPGEAEHHVMRGPQLPPSQGTISDIIFQENIEQNVNLQYGSSTPVNMYPPSQAGFHDVFGNVWEWTEDHFNGLPGYRSHFLYDDFSSPTFDGRHCNMMGGSWISTGDEASRFARYAFRRHFFQHLGFRMVQGVSQDNGSGRLPIRLITNDIFLLGAGFIDKPMYLQEELVARHEVVPSTNRQLKYDSEVALNEMLCFEYGGKETFTDTLTQLCASVLDKLGSPQTRALHLGCGTGKVTLTLAKLFEETVAVDTSGRFIDACLTLQENNPMSFYCPQASGAKRAKLKAQMERTADMGSIIFKQLSWLPNEVGFFDYVLLTMTDRLLNAEAWLVRLREVIQESGILMISSVNQVTKDQQARMLGPMFTYVEEHGIPVIPIGSDDGEVATVTVWRKM